MREKRVAAPLRSGAAASLRSATAAPKRPVAAAASAVGDVRPVAAAARAVGDVDVLTGRSGAASPSVSEVVEFLRSEGHADAAAKLAREFTGLAPVAPAAGVVPSASTASATPRPIRCRPGENYTIFVLQNGINRHRPMYFRRADLLKTGRGDVDIPWRRVAARPRPRRGYSAEASRGAAAAAT